MQNIIIRSETHKRLKKLSKSLDIPMVEIIEKAVENYENMFDGKVKEKAVNNDTTKN